MCAVNVDFYEKIKILQEKQHNCEIRRMDLDQNLASQATSDNKLAKLRAVRLQNYWKKICDDEKRSQWRNEQLLKDVERVEKHMSALDSRTDKLKQMKKQYEDYVERMYPNWKEKVLHYRHIKQEAERRADVASKPPQIPAGYVNIPDMQNPSYRISHTLPNMGQSPRASNQVRPDQSPATPMSHTSQDYRVHVEDRVGGEGLVLPISARSLPGGGEGKREVLDTPDSPVRIPVGNDQVMNQPGEDTMEDDHQLQRKKDSEETYMKQASLDEFSSEDEMDNVLNPLTSPRQESPSRNESAQHTPRSSRGSFSPSRTPDLILEQDLATEERSVYVEAEVTLEGLCNLLHAVEEDLPNCHTPEDFYRSQMPAMSVRKEVIFNANKAATLSHLDAASISMVILDQLPLLVSSCEGGCLLPDSLLLRPPATPSNEIIRSRIHPTCHSFWNTLYHHFVQLLKYSIMTAAEASEIFAPLLITDDSPYETRAKGLMADLLESVNPNELLHSPGSTSTFSTFTSPQKREEGVYKEGNDFLTASQDPPSYHEEESEHGENDARPSIVPQLSLPRSESEFDDGDKVNIQVTVPTMNNAAAVPPTGTSTTPLTQTAAYRQFLGDTMSSQKTMSYEDSEPSSDDIENQLGLGSPQRNKPLRDESSYADVSQDDITETSATVPAADTKPSWLTEMQKSSTPQPASAAAKASTPSRAAMMDDTDQEFDLESTGGYVPSGIDTGKSGKSSMTFSLGSTGKQAARKKAFMYGDSDTDEDIDVPGTSEMKAGQSEEEKDDFDFYD